MSDFHNKKTCSKLEDKTTDFNEALGLRIRSIRLQNKIPQAEFARVLHVNEKLLAKIEKGLEQPDGWLLFILESSLAINVNWLMTGEGEMIRGKGRSKEDLAYLLIMYNQLSKNSKNRVINIIKMFIHSDHTDMLKRLAGVNYED